MTGNNSNVAPVVRLPRDLQLCFTTELSFLLAQTDCKLTCLHYWVLFDAPAVRWGWQRRCDDPWGDAS